MATASRTTSTSARARRPARKSTPPVARSTAMATASATAATSAPTRRAGAKVDERGCELDSDGDGVVDSQDKCPDTPKGDRVDADGLLVQGRDQTTWRGVRDRKRRAQTRESAGARRRDRDAEALSRAQHRSRGPHGQPRLGRLQSRSVGARAPSRCSKYLQDGGVTNALKSRGYGERQPIGSNTSDDGRQQNRRVVLRVLN